MGLTALDLGLRGAASGVFLMMVLVLLRLRPYNKHVLLGIAMSAGGAAFAIATAPYIPKSSFWWTLPIISAQPVVIWLWAQTNPLMLVSYQLLIRYTFIGAVLNGRLPAPRATARECRQGPCRPLERCAPRRSG